MKIPRFIPLMIVPALLAQAACGEDEEAAQAPAAGGPAKAAKAAEPNGNLLSPMPKVEDQVSDPVEKASIRHQFRDSDFMVDPSIGQTGNRDPFHSFVLIQPGLATNNTKPVIVKGPDCKRPEQFVASNYTFADLKLVGIVTQGTQRKVLMMDPGNLGHIIRRNDCVGKEKAVVKDIGTGYITFVINPSDASDTSEEHSVPLYPNQMPIMSSPDVPSSSSSSDGPIVAPPSATPGPPPRGTIAPPAEKSPRKK